MSGSAAPAWPARTRMRTSPFRARASVCSCHLTPKCRGEAATSVSIAFIESRSDRAAQCYTVLQPYLLLGMAARLALQSDWNSARDHQVPTSMNKARLKRLCRTSSRRRCQRFPALSIGKFAGKNSVDPTGGLQSICMITVRIT